MLCVQYLHTSPKPATTTTLPAIITSVARLIPSANDSRHPYRLSNLLLVTLSFTLMAGTKSSPFSIIWYKRWTPVVVSSDTPFQSLIMRVHMPGWDFKVFFNKLACVTDSGACLKVCDECICGDCGRLGL